MEDMRTALEAYKHRMATSNRQFWTGKVHALEQDSTLTDRQRLDLLAPYAQLGKWPTSGHGSSVTTPAQVLLRPGDAGYVDLNIDGHGVAPPKPAAVRERYLAALARLIDDVYQASPDKPAEPARLDVPAEFRHFLELSDGVSDFDYHQLGGCGLDGGFFTDLPNRFWMSDRLPEESTWRGAGWAVASGWQASIGDLASTAILYCRNEAAQRNWAWRVFNYDNEAPDGRWFDSIVEFLDFKAGWLERLGEGWDSRRMGPPIDAGEWPDEDEEEQVEAGGA